MLMCSRGSTLSRLVVELSNENNLRTYLQKEQLLVLNTHTKAMLLPSILPFFFPNTRNNKSQHERMLKTQRKLLFQISRAFVRCDS
jgi:hypothetical protein